jgi:hypothetical protein
MNALRTASWLGVAAALALGTLVLPAHADDLGKLLGDGQSVQPNVLAAQRGGTSASIDASAVANVSNNWSYGNTGTNSFGSFGNGQGVLTAVQNTGNGVAIQTQVIVNVSLQ